MEDIPGERRGGREGEKEEEQEGKADAVVGTMQWATAIWNCRQRVKSEGED
jgi:hypothetical protein